MKDVKGRLTSLEVSVANLRGEVANLHGDLLGNRVASTGSRSRLERIESRLSFARRLRRAQPCKAALAKGRRGVPWRQTRGNAMSKHYDTLETRTPAEREKALMQALPQQIAHAKANAPFFKDWLKDVDPAVGDLARGAGQAAGAAQVDAGRGAEEESADGRPDRRADEQGAPRLHVARPDLRDRHRRARLFPRRARHACRRASGRATSSTTPSPIT